MEKYLQLENGQIFKGTAFGYHGEASGEVVFQTAMSGHGEILTNPSYQGQMMVFTFPLIGNGGIHLEDFESQGPTAACVVVKEVEKSPAGFRCEMDLSSYLAHKRIPGIEGVDTRALAKVLRAEGPLRGVLTKRLLTKKEMERVFQKEKKEALAYEVTTKEPYTIAGEGHHVVVMDLGVKKSTLKILTDHKLKVTVLPCSSSLAEFLAVKPQGVLLSEGPGDPKEYEEILDVVKALAQVKPILGLSLGHQLLALAFGGETKKLPYGHRGGNHPVLEKETEKIFITKQHHGYVACDVQEELDITHVSLSDGTIEGMRHKRLPVSSVQFQLDACQEDPATKSLFQTFLKDMEGK